MNDVLYIIGNGFDLHHRLKTSYAAFRDSFAKKKQRLWNSLESLYGEMINQDMWWCSFEEMLGMPDYRALLESRNGEAMSSFKVRQFLKSKLPFYFGEWIQSIDDIVKPDTALKIDDKSQFFTFNYTLLLEKTYGIDARQIWHIHNSKLDLEKGERIIVGPDSSEEKLISYSTNDRNHCQDIEFAFKDSVNREIREGGKKVENRVSLLRNEFSSRFSCIRHYISMGFSYGGMDIPYIKKIIEVNNYFSDADWLLYSHSEEECDSLLNTMQKLGVDRKKVKIASW